MNRHSVAYFRARWPEPAEPAGGRFLLSCRNTGHYCCSILSFSCCCSRLLTHTYTQSWISALPLLYTHSYGISSVKVCGGHVTETLTCAGRCSLGDNHVWWILWYVMWIGGRAQAWAHIVHHLLVLSEGRLSVHSDRVGGREVVLRGVGKATGQWSDLFWRLIPLNSKTGMGMGMHSPL